MIAPASRLQTRNRASSLRNDLFSPMNLQTNEKGMRNGFDLLQERNEQTEVQLHRYDFHWSFENPITTQMEVFVFVLFSADDAD